MPVLVPSASTIAGLYYLLLSYSWSVQYNVALYKSCIVQCRSSSLGHQSLKCGMLASFFACGMLWQS
jgi:hypothetical protein